mgnify:CR=1 FL=1
MPRRAPIQIAQPFVWESRVVLPVLFSLRCLLSFIPEIRISGQIRPGFSALLFYPQVLFPSSRCFY